ncbi:MAG: hypothetical protein AAGJ28_04850 [Pseudomonadota bacterium]
MNSTFSDFADMMAHPVRAAPAAPDTFGRYAVLGGGADARLLAATALSEGAEVTLFSAYGAELSAMASGIALRGAGPLGSYQVNADAAPSVRATAELDAAVQGAEVIFLTGPVHKQRTYAMVLADHLTDGQVLVLAPGRTFGALETRYLLSIGGCAADVTIAEAGTLPFWYAPEGATLNLSAAVGAPGGVLPGNRRDVCAGLNQVLPNAEFATSTLASSFADGSGLAEVPALLLGGPAMPDGGPAIPMGGTPLPENQTFRNLIGSGHMTVIEDLAGERRETARRFGIRDLPDTGAWLDMFAGTAAGDGSRPLPDATAVHGVVRDAVIGSLAPLASAARIAGVATPATDAMTALASSVLKADLSTAGRKLTAMGISGGDVDAARRALEEAA